MFRGESLKQCTAKPCNHCATKLDQMTGIQVNGYVGPSCELRPRAAPQELEGRAFSHSSNSIIASLQFTQTVPQNSRE